MKMTDWFPPEIKPVYVGWYHTNNPTLTYFSIIESLFNWWWNGDEWMDYPDGNICRQQIRYWRGLTEKPE